VQPHFVAPVRANPANAGHISGVRLQHGKAHLVRAVLEGLAYELARHLDLARAANVPVQSLVLCGAAARSRVTPQIIADVARLSVTCLAEHDTSAFGAAMLARGLLEPDAPLQAIATGMQAGTRTVTPGPQHDLYAALLEEYLDAT
jgi:sugar (pentulose or hexulose) kinase